MGQNYGRIGNRRRGGGAWQWMLIGFFPGIMCGGLIIFLLLLGGVFNGFSAEPTPMVITEVVEIREIITTTPLATVPPMIVTATPETAQQPAADAQAQTGAADTTTADTTSAQTGSGESVVILASSTPTLSPEEQSFALATELAGGGADQTAGAGTIPNDQNAVEGALAQVPAPTLSSAGAATGANPVSNVPAVPPQLAGIISPMVQIEGAVFTMGTNPNEIIEAVDQCLQRDGGACQAAFAEDSQPEVQVELGTFMLERTEVSFDQYVTFLNYISSQGRRHTNGCAGFICIQTQNEVADAVITFDGANYDIVSSLLPYPVYGVTWYGAQAYCEAIGRRLPTEAEWEHAARGNDGRIYPWGNQWAEANAWVRIPVNETNPQGPSPVEAIGIGNASAVAGASIYGVLHMAGNVAEWVQDWYSADFYANLTAQAQPVFAPVGPPTGIERVLRGGSWNAVPFFARTMHRQSFLPAPDNTGEVFPRWIGFRCAADLETTATSGGVDPATLGSDIIAPAGDPTPAGVAPPEAEGGATGADDRG